MITLTKFNLEAKINHFYFKAEAISQSNIGVKGQAIHFYKLGLFESSHPVFCDYRLCSHVTRKRSTHLLEMIKIMRKYLQSRADTDSVTDRRRMRVTHCRRGERRSSVYKR